MQMELISRKEFDSRVTSGELDNLQAIKVKEGFCLIGNQSGTNRVFMLRRTDLKPFVWKNEIGPSSYAQTRGCHNLAFSTKTSFLWLIFKGYNMFKHWKNITIYKLSREADLTDLEDKKKMILFTPCGSQDILSSVLYLHLVIIPKLSLCMEMVLSLLKQSAKQNSSPPVIQRAIQEKN